MNRKNHAGMEAWKMEVDMGDKIILTFDSDDETLGIGDIKEALEFIWRQSHTDISHLEMDAMWETAKRKFGGVE